MERNATHVWSCHAKRAGGSPAMILLKTLAKGILLGVGGAGPRGSSVPAGRAVRVGADCDGVGRVLDPC